MMPKLHLLHHHHALLPRLRLLLLLLLLTLTLILAFETSSRCNGLNLKQKCGKLDIFYPFCIKNSSCEDRKPFHGMEHFELECASERAWIRVHSHQRHHQQQQQRYEVLDLGPEIIRINPFPENNDECGLNNLNSFNLIDTPFRLSNHNILQLYNCSKECDNCTIPLSSSTTVRNNCSALTHRRVCCEVLDDSYSSGTFFNAFSSSQSSMDANSLHSSRSDFTSGFMNLENYTLLYGCSAFSSWAYSIQARDSSLHAEFGLNVEWFLEGSCSCASNSRCIRRQDVKGFNCQCNPPHFGDGYVQCLLGFSGRHRPNKEHTFRVFESTVFLAGMIVAAFIIGAAVVGVVLLRWRKEQRRETSRAMATTKGDLDMFRGLLSGLELFSYKQLDKATKGFSLSEMLGTGASGAVYSANLEDGRRVAVKRLHHFHTQMGYKQMVNELSVLCTVKHRNLVRLFGYCLESPEPLLVFEFVSNGTLAEHLQRERGQGLSWFTRLTIVAETADALAYLHSMTPPVLHRDVKSRNILLDHEFNTKVADFGLSRMGTIPPFECSHISTIPQGTPGYLDPDYHQNFHLSDKSDVYSFGVVLIEIITSLKPVDFSREKKEVNLAALAVAKIASGRLEDIMDKSLQAHRRPSVKAMVQRVAELAFRCLAYDKDARPCMREVLEELLLIRGSVAFPVVDIDESESAASLSSSEMDCYLLGKNTPSLSAAAMPRRDNRDSSMDE